MFEQVREQEVSGVLEYFSRDRMNCLYSYIDLKKYGLSHPRLEVYADRDRDGRICCVLTKYFDGVNVFSHGQMLDASETVHMLKKLDPVMINGPGETLRLLYPLLSECYEYEEGYVTQIHQVRKAAGQDGTEKVTGPDVVEEAAEADLPEIARLICSDEGLGGTYEPEALAAQLLERRRDGFGRNFCIRRDGRIVCHAGTYAEVDDLAVISGVITAEDSRGQKLADKVVSKLSSQLLSEGKLPCLFYYTRSAARLYENVGFEPGAAWAKLIRKQG